MTRYLVGVSSNVFLWSTVQGVLQSPVFKVLTCHLLPSHELVSLNSFALKNLGLLWGGEGVDGDYFISFWLFLVLL